LFIERSGQWATRFVDAINGAGFWPAPPGTERPADHPSTEDADE